MQVTFCQRCLKYCVLFFFAAVILIVPAFALSPVSALASGRSTIPGHLIPALKQISPLPTAPSNHRTTP